MIINNAIKEFRNDKMEVILIGDFNIDPYRNKGFDNILNDYINRSNLIRCNILFTQKYDYTFKKPIKKSLIDHVITNHDNKIIEQVNVLNDTYNNSDHLALEVIIKKTNEQPIAFKPTKNTTKHITNG